MRVLLVLLLLGVALARLPDPYAGFVAARSSGDVAALRALAAGNSYAAILAARELGRAGQVPAAERLPYAERAARFDGAAADWLVVARVRQQLGEPGVVAAYARAMPLPEARRELELLARQGREDAYAALYDGGAYEELLAVLPPAGEAAWHARALYRLGRYQEALPWYQRWAAGSPEGSWGLARLLLKLGDYQLAAAVYETLEGPRAADGLGEALLGLGRREAAAAAFARGDAAGRWRAAGLYEELGRQEEALRLYRELARGDSLYADDAELRLWVLARRRGDVAEERWAYAGLSGGLAVLVGKPWPQLPENRSVYVTPPHAARVRALALADRQDWAWGEVRWQLAAEDTPQRRRAYAALLEELGMWGRALKLTRNLERESRSDWMLDYPRAYEDEVRRAAAEFGLEPELLWAVMRVESRFDPRAVSPTGARGLMQFTGGTWADVSRKLGAADPFDPAASIRYGAYYLAAQLRACDGLLVCALSAYNGGPGYTRRALAAAGGDVWDFLRFQPRDEPREYVERVYRSYAIYKALYR